MQLCQKELRNLSLSGRHLTGFNWLDDHTQWILIKEVKAFWYGLQDSVPGPVLLNFLVKRLKQDLQGITIKSANDIKLEDQRAQHSTLDDRNRNKKFLRRPKFSKKKVTWRALKFYTSIKKNINCESVRLVQCIW